IFSRKEMPSMFGISTSSVSTSGFSSLIMVRAISGSGAAPTTSISGSLASAEVSSWRISALSSTTRTLIFLPATALPSSDLAMDVAAQQLEPLGDAEQILRMADIEEAAGHQQVGVAVEQRALGVLVEIDHHIAAEDHIEGAFHRPGLDEIEVFEADQRAGFVAEPDLVGTMRCEILAGDIGRYAFQRRGIVDALRPAPHHLGIDIGGQHPG